MRTYGRGVFFSGFVVCNVVDYVEGCLFCDSPVSIGGGFLDKHVCGEGVWSFFCVWLGLVDHAVGFFALVVDDVFCTRTFDEVGKDFIDSETTVFTCVPQLG